MFDNKNNGLTFSEKLSVTMLFCMALFASVRGVYWNLNPVESVNDSPLYEKLNDIAPLQYWGYPFIVAAGLIIVSCFLLIRHKRTILFYGTFIAGSLLCSFTHAMLYLTAVEHSFNWITPAHNCIIAVMWLSIAGIGVEALWKKKKYGQ